MSGQDRRYTAWIREQPCCACGTPFQIEPHHSLYGTTYSPEEPKPPKAIQGARKGGAQKSHDHFQIPLCFKCHEPGIHKLDNYFAGWTREEAYAFEEREVAKHRARYAMQSPEPIGGDAPKRTRPARGGDAAARERSRIVEYLRDRAGEARLKPNESALLADIASEIEAQQPEHF